MSKANKKSIVFLLLLLCIWFSSAEEVKERDYSFTLYDGSLNLFTMRQFNEGYTSLHRMTMRAINDVLGDKKVIDIKLADILSLTLSGVFMAFTHEEGHRSISTYLGYGSFSNPFFDLSGKAFSYIPYSNSFPVDYYRRLASAGFESDYLMCRNDTISAVFLSKTSDITFYDFFPRNLNATGYLFYSIRFGNLVKDIDDVDATKFKSIDSYRLAASLFHPEVENAALFEAIILDDQREFLDRIAFRSLINLANPFMIGIPSIKISDDFSFSVFMNYSICPFGDFIEETAAVKYKNINADIYVRQYQNKDFWFPSFGIGLTDFRIHSFSVDAGFHFWMQPEDLSFISSVGKPGCAGEVKLTWFIPNSKDFPIKSTGISLGVSGKTKGFLPGYESHENDIRLSAGFTIRY